MKFSEEKLQFLRRDLSPVVPEGAICLVVGSYARREASEGSDLDYVLLSPEDDTSATIAPAVVSKIKDLVVSIIPTAPAADGAFGSAVSPTSLLTNLGGANDTNENITRRMLLLLEGDWLANEGGFNKLRHSVIERYVEATPRDHQLALFLLNDVIRYWRTMTVDYVFKTTELASPKAGAIRNIKLVFSRKLMYAGGLFTVGMTADRTKTSKIDLLDELFRMPVIDRMIHICGNNQMSRVLASYNIFLESVENKTTRDHLKSLAQDNWDDQIFRNLKNEAHHFTRELLSVFERTFHSTHPIRRAVIF